MPDWRPGKRSFWNFDTESAVAVPRLQFSLRSLFLLTFAAGVVVFLSPYILDFLDFLFDTIYIIWKIFPGDGWS